MYLVFDNFFRHLYPIPVLSFLHKASLIERYRNGLRDEILLYALVGITSLLTKMSSEIKMNSSQYIDKAQSLVLAQFEQPSITKIQALVFIIEHRILSERSEAAFTLISIAVRHSYALRLNYENPNLCFLARESRRRLMWSLFLFDLHLASGLSDFTLCPAESIHIRLPCREESFELDIEQTTEPLCRTADEPPSCKVGLVAFFIRLYWIRGKILHTTKRLVVSRAQDLHSITSQVLALGTELRVFAANLPSGYELTERNLHLRAHTSRVAPYTLLYIWWLQCHCDLYRIALEGLYEALPRQIISQLDPTFVITCQRECFENARTMVDTFRTILSLKEHPPFLDFHLPICAYQCARILFYTYRTNAAAFCLSLDGVIEQTNRCLDMIKFSPSPRQGLLVIQRDLEHLMELGCSRSPSPNAQPGISSRQSEPPSSGPGASQHIISRHSLIKGIGVENNREELAVQSPIPPGTKMTPQSEYLNVGPILLDPSPMVNAHGHQQTPITSEYVPAMPENGNPYIGPGLDDPTADYFTVNTFKWAFNLWPSFHDPTATIVGQGGPFGDGWENYGDTRNHV
ncbi:uncharacterized protein A1O9_06628 [Exophiala aquamarina CBS 119918]|uniref:Xylanolytic transcriptional activator regulatory domain-containing protein n=1 Tax=Exophiala aquamarina CBS 119918 TaxID=1182545 RepID=A0A072PG11_9EURO|nr:uncharacterized protein A1O9_06628 [Exophiala aquamarina CBS 119918]KEF58702.1 hypothetical protein A1O9_06628 [Exophiala aquamarina CBS 119918]